MSMLLRLRIGSATHDAAPDAELTAKWGRENCIVYGRARYADFGPCTHTLSIRAAWGGVQHCHVDGRTIGVDDDNFLILNHGRIYSTSIRSEQTVESLAICFSPRLVEQIHFEGRSSQFLEHLRPHDAVVSPALQSIRQALAARLQRRSLVRRAADRFCWRACTPIRSNCSIESTGWR